MYLDIVFIRVVTDYIIIYSRIFGNIQSYIEGITTLVLLAISDLRKIRVNTNVFVTKEQWFFPRDVSFQTKA